MKAICYGFIPIAAVGLALSVIVHVLALFGRRLPFGELWWVLHVGIFFVFIPAVLVQQRITREFKLKDQWRASLRGCPPWVPRALQVLGVYALVNFIRFALVNHGNTEIKGEPPPEILWGFSGHWMVFYASAWAMLYSATRADAVDASSRCANGHLVSPLARYCDQCGSSVAGSSGQTPGSDDT